MTRSGSNDSYQRFIGALGRWLAIDPRKLDIGPDTLRAITTALESIPVPSGTDEVAEYRRGPLARLLSELIQRMWTAATVDLESRSHVSAALVKIWTEHRRLGLPLVFTDQNWKALATIAGQRDDLQLLDALWGAYQGTAPKPRIVPLLPFAIAAGSVGSRELLLQAWPRLMPLAPSLIPAAIGTLADKARGLDCREMLRDLWTALGSRVDTADQRTLGSFFKAAAELRDAALLRRIWHDTSDHCAAFNSITWGTLAYAAGACHESDLLLDVWEHAQRHRDVLEHQAFSVIANAASLVGQPGVVLEALECWAPTAQTFKQNEHRTWMGFLDAARALGREDIFYTIFRRMESLFDPTALPNRGYLDAYLRRATMHIEDEQLVLAIDSALRGATCDLDHCCDVLATQHPMSSNTPGTGQFEGACRSVMKWLVNSYYNDPPPVFVEKINELFGRLSLLPLERRLAFWLGALTRGQDAHRSSINFSVAAAFNSRVAPGRNKMSDDEWIAALCRDENGVMQQVNAFLTNDLESLGMPGNRRAFPADSPAASLVPLVEYIVANHVAYRAQTATISVDEFQSQTAELFRAAYPATLTESDWRSALVLLLDMMSAGVRQIWQKELGSFFHDHVKNNLVARHRARLLAPGCTEATRRLVAAQSREELDGIVRRMIRTQPRELTPINLTPTIKTCLLHGRRGRAGAAIAPGALVKCTITAWDGARDQVLVPMLSEIRRNAETALSYLSEGDQYYHVDLDATRENDVDYAVLAVANAYDPMTPQSPHSTGRGLGNVARHARSLGGFAAWNRDARPESGRLVWEWKLYFPVPPDGTAG